MKSIVIAGMIGISFFSQSLYAQSTNVYPSIKTKQSIQMKEYILFIRLPLVYGADQAKEVREKWNQVVQKWKTDSVFVTSYVSPNEGYLISGSERTTHKEYVVSNGLRMVSTIVLRAASLEDAVELAKACPILEQAGTVEVRELAQNTVNKP